VTTPASFGLIVNTGGQPLTETELSNAVFQVIASEPDFTATPFINNSASISILPGEAVGVIEPTTELFRALVDPSETIRDLPNQFFSISIERWDTTYQGLVMFDVVMYMAGEQVAFTIVGNFTTGDDANGIFDYLTATRVSSAAVPTATKAGTWGAVKALYR
jgi:hypothetical protein